MKSLIKNREICSVKYFNLKCANFRFQTPKPGISCLKFKNRCTNLIILNIVAKIRASTWKHIWC